jgi:hypothetical protein
LHETVNTIWIKLEEEKIALKKQLADTAQVLGQLTKGQTEIQRDMTSRDEQHVEAFTAMPDNMTALTASIQELLHIRTSTTISTPPPPPQRTDSDTLMSDSTCEHDSDSLRPGQKRSPNGSPSKQNPCGSRENSTTHLTVYKFEMVARGAAKFAAKSERWKLIT